MGGTVSFTVITLLQPDAPPGPSVVKSLCLGGSSSIVHLFAIRSGDRDLVTSDSLP